MALTERANAKLGAVCLPIPPAPLNPSLKLRRFVWRPYFPPLLPNGHVDQQNRGSAY